MEPDTAPRTARNGLTSAGQVTVKSDGTPPLPKFGTPEFKRTLAQRGQKWLDSRGRDAAGLIAMWDITGDKALLDEAAEKFPNDPRVCMAMIQLADRHTKRLDLMSFIERLIVAEPANPDSLYQKVWALMPESFNDTSGEDRTGALAALRQAAVMNGPRNDHLSERVQAAREAALAIGVGSGDAARLALNVANPVGRSYPNRTLNGALGALYRELAEAKASGSEERLVEIIGLGLTTAEKFSGEECITILVAMDAQQLKAVMMESLPENALTDAGERSVGVMREQVKERRRYLAQFNHREAEEEVLLGNASDDVRVAYLDRFMGQGEVEARKWLLEQAGQAK